jgi:S1-C subfamily serine protease
LQVVEITVTRTIRFAGREGAPSESEAESVLGTGFVIDRRGSIVTNEHVIDGGGTISVRLADGTVARGSLIGSDTSTDLAVVRIRVAVQHLHPLQLGTTDSLVLGAPVLAIGTPFGYSGSVSAGVVSGFDRQIESPSGYTLGDAIQADAAVNHGNSSSFRIARSPIRHAA